MNPAVWYCTASRYRCLSANSVHNAICFCLNSTAKLFSNTILITPRHLILVLNAQEAYILARVPLANKRFFQAGLCSKLKIYTVFESYQYIFVIYSVFVVDFHLMKIEHLMFMLYWKSRQL